MFCLSVALTYNKATLKPLGNGMVLVTNWGRFSDADVTKKVIPYYLF